MASRISISLHYVTLFLLLAQISHSSAPIPKTKNHTELSTYIVHADHLAKPSHFAKVEHWYSSMIATYSPREAASSSRILYVYDTVMHGFAVRLTGDEARRMSNATGVTGVYEDRQFRPLTTRTPGFLGLEPGFGAWQDTDYGDGVIIGIMDTGIWPESASFNDSGLGPVRASWKGMCVDAEDFNATSCNNKLIGAKAFGAASPRDTDGHGTHVASTAAGSEVRNAGLGVFARGTARGMAPKAKIAMYKTQETPPITDVVAAMDAAVKDGVDILSMSYGDDPPPKPFHMDPLAIAAFGAVKKGVFVVLAGGNDGPTASTVTNLAPWMTTVGAGTVDRLFPANLHLGDGTVVTGQSLYCTKENHTAIPLVSSTCNEGDMTPGKILGKIVVCINQVDSPGEIQNAGGSGLVLVDKLHGWSLDGSAAEPFNFPALILSYTAGEKLGAYMASVPNPVASFSFGCETVIGKSRAPMVAAFSSRGPNLLVPELLKPDVIAPGLNILAATKDSYKFNSGTSMATPHVAGVAALIKKKHPSWTPAMIRSAMMTTAGTIDNMGKKILDDGITDGRGGTVATPLAAGAGHVRPELALDPGLVYDAGAGDYVDFLCAINYTVEQLRRFAPDMATSCTQALPGGPAGLNYPSFVVVFDGRGDVRTLTRTVTKVSTEAETYNVTVVAPRHVKVTVTPATLDFKQQYEKKSYSVEFRSDAGGSGWEFGHIIWENMKRQVRSPVAFMWKN
ncbi:hypothetical protein EJB05_53297, partial [Eragrostis curvula]